MTARNVTYLLSDRAAEAPHRAALNVLVANGTWLPLSRRQFEDRVRILAKGLVAADLQPGDAVAIMAPTQYEWALVDMAVWYAAGVVVPIYDSASAEQVNQVVADADVRLAFVGNPAQGQLLMEALDAADAGRAASLGVWLMSEATSEPIPGELPYLNDLVDLGYAVEDETIEQLRSRADLTTIATIVYTSGTQSTPKGALITHGDLVGKVEAVTSTYGEVVKPEGNTIIVLPLAHVLARGLQLLCLSVGMRIAHLSDPKQLVAAMAQLRPTFLAVVPRVLEKVREEAARAATDQDVGWVWRQAERDAITWGRHLELTEQGHNHRLGLGVRARRALFDKLFYRRIRNLFGGRIEYLLCGGAPLAAEDSLFFRGIGIPVIEGYVLTETTAPITGNLPGAIRSGTVGRSLPGCDVRITDDGEVQTRGVGVVRGYRDPKHDADGFDNGWLRTGDLGR